MFVTALAVWGMSLNTNAWKGEVTITTPNTQLLLHADENSDLRMDYYGSR